jgi:hypothetical protein
MTTTCVFDTDTSFPATKRHPHLGSVSSRRVAMTLVVAVGIAFGMSLQFLAQLFVWRNWPVREVLEGWLYIFRDRLIVALLIAAAIGALGVMRARTPWLRTTLLALSVLTGAFFGEIVVGAIYGRGDDAAALLAHALRWSAVALAVAASFHLWRASANSQEQLRRESLRHQNAQQQLAATRLTALRKQIEPHFLFNTLATVRRLHQTESASGAAMLAGFIDYLRRMLPMLDRTEVPLADELSVVSAYLSVIQIRMSGRLTVTVDVPTPLRLIGIPPLSLATLVENAVKHGLAPLPGGGHLSITAAEHGDVLALCVADNGVGLKAEGGGGSGIGLYNVRARLNTLHGAAAGLQVQANVPTGVVATIRIPIRRQGA